MEYGSRPAGQDPGAPTANTRRPSDHTRNWQRRRRADTIEQARLSGGRYPEEARVPRVERENPGARYQVSEDSHPFSSGRLFLAHPSSPSVGFPYLGPGYPNPPDLSISSRLPGWPFSSLQEIHDAERKTVDRYLEHVSGIGFPSKESAEHTWQQYRRLRETHDRFQAESCIDAHGNFLQFEHLRASPEQQHPLKQNRFSQEQNFPGQEQAYPIHEPPHPVQEQKTQCTTGSLIPPDIEGFDYVGFLARASERAALSASASKKKRRSLLDKIKPIFRRRAKTRQPSVTGVSPFPPTTWEPAPPRAAITRHSLDPYGLIQREQDQDSNSDIESPTLQPRARLQRQINQREVEFPEPGRHATAITEDSTYEQSNTFSAPTPLTSENLEKYAINPRNRSCWWTTPAFKVRAENGSRTFTDREIARSGNISSYNSAPDLFPELLPAPLLIQKTEEQNLRKYRTLPTKPSFLDSCLSAKFHPAKMDLLQVRSAERSSTKVKAVEDARQMQASVIEEAKKSGKDPPKYVLMELIGKGSFGRVYKGKDMISAAIVAVKIIDIDESDTLNPRLADTYSEFMKEVNALKILSISKARNINHVIEALPVGKAMWMITEYCGGGSIATLMKPTPGGLKERWIIPILREVAEAVKWVHQAGIIHRDLKCANVLITEEGGVQLCDFGVAGIIESSVDKRSTFIGTMNWMAPELFEAVPQYGKEVDIWAFGSMAYEMATGLPPNAMSGMTEPQDMGPYLKQHIPRLEGSKYSEGLRDIVAYCLEEKVIDRPNVEAVQKHAYICNTASKYPASSLSELVKAFKKWEDSGGTRRSLFMHGGAQGPSDFGPPAFGDDDWNFSTTAAFDQAVAQGTNVEDVINVYGSSVDMATEFADETSRPSRQQAARERGSRRRPPPEALAPLKAPLEKLFDPNTMSNYEDNSRSHYGRDLSMPTSDLPLRDDSTQISIRDTMIDLGGHDFQTGMSNFPDIDTIRPMKKLNIDEEDEYPSSLNDFSRAPMSDPADNLNRRTQDWKFPSMAPPASADPELSRFPVNYESYEMPSRPKVTPGSGSRPPLVHHPTEPISVPTQGFSNLVLSAPSSPSRLSLIDLDLSVPEPPRPSTADSTNSNGASSSNPFEFEKHASSTYQHSAREPSLYLNEDLVFNTQMHAGSAFNDLTDISDFSTSDAEGNYGSSNGHGSRGLNQSFDETSFADQDYSQTMPPPPNPTDHARGRNNRGFDMSHFPVLPSPPSVAAMSGTASQTEMMSEMHRMIEGFTAQLSSFKDVYEALPAGREKKEKEKSDRED